MPHGAAQEMEGEGRRTLELAEGALELGRWLQRPGEAYESRVQIESGLRLRPE